MELLNIRVRKINHKRKTSTETLDLELHTDSKTQLDLGKELEELVKGLGTHLYPRGNRGGGGRYNRIVMC